MKLLVSPKNRREIVEALEGGADIIDIKNPAEGSLGANFPPLIKYARRIIKNKELSVTIGDVPFLPGTVALATLGAASCGADYIKIGLLGPKNRKQAIFLLKKAVEAAKDYDTKIIGACYADFERAETMTPLLLPQVASEAGCFGCMIDTYIKDGKRLFDFLSYDFLEKFVGEAHRKGLLSALAGSLGENDMKKIKTLGAEVVGVRGAVCLGGRNGIIKRELVAKLRMFM